MGLYKLSLYWEVFGLRFGFLADVYMGFRSVLYTYVHFYDNSPISHILTIRHSSSPLSPYSPHSSPLYPLSLKFFFAASAFQIPLSIQESDIRT